MFNLDALSGIAANSPLLIHGLLNTLILVGAVMTCALVLGMLMALLRYYRVPYIFRVLELWVYGVRAIPVILILGMLHYGILPALGMHNTLFVSAFLGLTLSTSAYLSEIFRGGFLAIPSTQKEVAGCLGLSGYQQAGYIYIPQVFYAVLPAVVNQLVTLIKDTALVSLIGVIELTRAAEIIYEQTYQEGLYLSLLAFIYGLLCSLLSLLASHLQRRGSEDGFDALSLFQA